MLSAVQMMQPDRLHNRAGVRHECMRLHVHVHVFKNAVSHLVFLHDVQQSRAFVVGLHAHSMSSSRS